MDSLYLLLSALVTFAAKKILLRIESRPFFASLEKRSEKFWWNLKQLPFSFFPHGFDRSIWIDKVSKKTQFSAQFKTWFFKKLVCAQYHVLYSKQRITRTEQQLLKKVKICVSEHDLMKFLQSSRIKPTTRWQLNLVLDLSLELRTT